MKKEGNFFTRLFDRTRNKQAKSPEEIPVQQNDSLNIQLVEKDETLKKPIKEKESLEYKLDDINGKVKTANKKNDKIKIENDSLNTLLTEKDETLKKLLKEKESLEDELDDIKDEVKTANKMNKKIKIENEDFKNELRELKNVYTAQKQELEGFRQKSEFIENDLEIKTKSICFTNEILNAQLANDSSAEEIRDKTKTIVDFVKNNVCEDFRSVTDFTVTYLDEIKTNIEKWANLEQKTWLKDKIVIAFVGQFSAGKTSIVNRILSQDIKNVDFKLPVSTAPTTAIATYISYDKDMLVQFTDRAGDLKNINIETFKQFSKSALEKINLSQLVRHFVIKYNNKNLDKLSILDTTSFSSDDKDDERRTVEVIREADALFWVVDASVGEINSGSLNIIKQHMGDLPLYLIINKVDGMSNIDRTEIKNSMKETMKKNNISVKEYIEFSWNEPLDTLMSIVASIVPRREKVDVIKKINKHISELVDEYTKQTASLRTQIGNYQRDINDAEKVTDNYYRNFSTKEEIMNKKIKMLRSEDMIGTTFWGSYNNDKLKNPPEFWKLFYEIIKLDKDFCDASVKLGDNLYSKYNVEKKLETGKGYINTLKKLKIDFDNLLSDYGYEKS